MASRILLAAVFGSLHLGCGGSVVIHNNNTATPPANTAASATTAPATSRVEYSMRMRVQGQPPAEGSEARVESDVNLDANVCEGLTVDEVGETRSGRRLGMGLLQVYARPGAELIVDQLHQGATPLIAVGVDAGPRDVRLRNVELGYDCTFRLRVLPGVRYSLLLDVKPNE